MCGYFLILSEPAKKCQYLFIMFPSVLMEQLIISGPVPLECCFVFIGGVGSGYFVCVCVCVCVCMRTLSQLSCTQLFATAWPVAHQHQAPLFMDFSRQEYWSGLPFSSPGDLPNPGLLHCRQTLYQLSYEGSIITTTCRKNIYLYPYNSEPFGENNRGLYVCVCVHVCTHMCIHAYGRACTHVSLQISDY